MNMLLIYPYCSEQTVLVALTLTKQPAILPVEMIPQFNSKTSVDAIDAIGMLAKGLTTHLAPSGTYLRLLVFNSEKRQDFAGRPSLLRTESDQRSRAL